MVTTVVSFVVEGCLSRSLNLVRLLNPLFKRISNQLVVHPGWNSSFLIFPILFTTYQIFILIERRNALFYFVYLPHEIQLNVSVFLTETLQIFANILYLIYLRLFLSTNFFIINYILIWGLFTCYHNYRLNKKTKLLFCSFISNYRYFQAILNLGYKL